MALERLTQITQVGIQSGITLQNVNVDGANVSGVVTATSLNVTGSGAFSSNLTLNNQTASTIASFDANKNISSLSTATYPSLTELSYVKGVTSALQTQLNAKQSTLTNPVTGTGVASHIAYWNSSSGIVADSGQLYWDATNNRLGIGTASPSGQLHVIGTGLFASTTGIIPNSLLNVYSATSGATIFNVEGTNGSLFSVVDSLSGSLMSVNNNAGLPVFEVFSDDKIVGGRYNQNDFVISSGGNVGIGTASPSYKLHVAGDIYATGDVTAYSDARLKTNIKTIDSALDKVDKLRGVYYTHIETQKDSIGLIAQETLDVLPEVVATKGEYLGINYGNIVGLLVEAIKELRQELKNKTG